MAQDDLIKNKAEVDLSENDIWSIVNFARSMTPSYLTPDMINARMKDIALNPMAASQDLLDKALANPKASETQLQEFSQSFELTSMVYKRLLGYLTNMLAFDITYTSDAKPEEYKTAKYRKDLETVERFLEKFQYKKELRIVTKELLRNDAYFGCFVDTGNKFILQELPSEYCKITGRWEGGFLFSFNMYWFIQPGIDINMYPSFFKRKYKELWGNANTTQKYIPSLSPELRAKSSWVYWVDVPVNLGVCFKLTPELATRLPYFSPLFNDLVLQGLMRNLQKNINMAAASKMIMGEVPMLNKDTKAALKDQIAISPDLLGKFMALVKSAISDSIKVASAPLENITPISFDTDNELYDSYLKTALATSGINTNLIFTSNIKPNVMETQLSLNVDEQMMEGLYQEYNNFMNYFINRCTKIFKFNIEFEGTEFFTSREQRFERAMTLFDKGIVLPQKIAAAIGMKPAQLRKQMEEASAYDFIKSLTVPSFEQQKEIIKLQPKPVAGASTPKKVTPPADETGAGRPKKKLSELGDEGANTRGSGGNLGRGGKN